MRFDVWVRLTDLGVLERGPKGEPLLTPHGEKTFVAIEAGDNIAEFDGKTRLENV